VLFAELLPEFVSLALIAEVLAVDLLVSMEDMVIRVLLL
jgi:hypothetical protein